MEWLEGGLGCLGMEDWATESKLRDGLKVGIGLGYVAWARSRCARSLASRSRSDAIGTGFKFQVGRRGSVPVGTGQGEEEDGPWVVKVRTESCHWTGMSGRGPLRPWEVWAKGAAAWATAKE